MGSSSINAAGLAVLAALTTAAPASATAQSARVIRVPCSAASLTNAVITANGLGSAALRLAPSCVYDLTATLPIITGNLALIGGPSTTIRRDASAPTFAILTTGPGVTLHVSGVFILNGNGATGGGIANQGTAFLDHVTLSGNTAVSGGAVETFPGAHTVLRRSVVVGNTATTNGGGLETLGRTDVFESRITGNNSSLFGGGVSTEVGGVTRLVRSTIDHNLSGANGGGISNPGTTSLFRTLVEHNSAAGTGGGVFDLAPGAVTSTLSVIRLNTPNNCSPAGVVPGCVN